MSNQDSNIGKVVLIGGALTVGGIYLAKKLISASNLQSQVSFYLSNVTGNTSLNLIKKGRIELTTTLRIINGSSISIPFSIAQAKIIYKGTEIAVSKPDAEIVLGANSAVDKNLIFEVPLIALGLQSDVVIDLATSFLTTGGIKAKLASIMGNITPNISLSTTASINGITANFIKKLETLPTTKGIALSAGERTISDGSAFNKYFKNSTRTNVVLNYDGGIPDVINNMVKIVETHYHETDAIAQLLKGANTLETSRNIWNFAVKYIRYQNDRVGVEELRTPVRSWNDGQIQYYQNGQSEYGIDCDDFAMFCGSILKSLGIPFQFRITKYYHRSYFQHVYLYIPNGNGGKDIIIDPVVDAFNYEKPYTDQADNFNMASLDGAIGSLSGMPIEMLSGFEGVGTVNGMPIEMLEGNDEKSDLYHLLNGTDLDGFDEFSGLGDTKQADDAVYNYLVRTRKVIASNPNAIKSYSSNPAIILSMFDKAIESYYTPQRDAVMEALSQFEDQLSLNGTIQGIDGELGGFFKKVASAVKKVNKQAVAVAKKVGKAVLVTANPLFISMRGGIILAMKLNLFGMAKKFQYGYLSEAQAKANNLNMDNWRKAVGAKNKMESIFTKLGGKPNNFKEAIIHGRKAEAMLKGIGEIGVIPVAIVTAMGVMAPAITLASKVGTMVGDAKKATDGVKAVIPTSVKENINSKLKSAVSNTVQSVVAPERKKEINVLMDKAKVKSVADAKKLVDSGKMTASELYNTMTPASRKNLSPERSQLLDKMLIKEASNSNSTEQQDNKTTEQQNNTKEEPNTEVSQSNNTTMADDTANANPSFFEKNKKAIFIGTGITLLALTGIAVYASVSGDSAPKQVTQRSSQNREAIAPQGLNGVKPKYKKKSKKRRQLSGVSL